MQKMIENKGITLISLVVTIILLIILAGVSINLVFGQRGILQRVKDSKEMQIQAEILQELELQKGQITIDGKGHTDLQEYLNYIKNKEFNGYKITNVSEIKEDETGRYAEIWVNNKYCYTAAQIDNNVVINSKGSVSKLLPEIKTFDLETTTNSIKVTVGAIFGENYTFILEGQKEDGTVIKEEYEIKKSKKDTNEIETVEYTFNEVERIEEDYTVKVIVKNINGEDEDSRSINIQPLEDPNFKFTHDPEEWTNGNVTVTVSTEITGYKLETSIDGENWDNINSRTFTENGELFARLTDGTNTTGITIENIDNIDKTNPEAPTLEVSSGTASNGYYRSDVTIKVTAGSDAGGSDVEKVTYILSGATTKEETEITSGETFTITNNGTTEVTAYTYDNAGNKSTEKTLTINKDSSAPGAPTVTASGTASNGYYKSNITIKVTAGKDTGISNVQKVTYKLNGATVKGETTITSGGTFTISNEGTTKVTAYTYDNAGNKSSAKTLTVKKDTIAPSTPSISITNITVNQGGWSYTISTSSSDSNGVTYSYQDGYNGKVFGTTTNNSYTISGKGWFSYGNICVKAQDPAGNVSWSSGVYLNAKRLYIRQLYSQIRNSYNIEESEVNNWDLNYGKGAIIAYGIFGSTESHNLRNSAGMSTYIDRMYLGIMGRASDSGGKSSMESIYNQNGGGTVGNVYMMLAFVNSAEAQNIYTNNGFGQGTVTLEECKNTFGY